MLTNNQACHHYKLESDDQIFFDTFYIPLISSPVTPSLSGIFQNNANDFSPKLTRRSSIWFMLQGITFT